MADRTTTLAFILKDGASKGMRELNKTARSLEKTAGTLNAPFAAAAKGFAIAGAAAVAVGGAMFAAAKAAAEEDASIARLNAAISANTKITDEQAKQMDAAIESRQNLAFSDDALRDSLSRLVPRTKDVTKALELQSIAMDFARLRGVDLSTASDLVGKVFNGNVSILSRYGFTVEEACRAYEWGYAEAACNTKPPQEVMDRIQSVLYLKNAYDEGYIEFVTRKNEDILR